MTVHLDRAWALSQIPPRARDAHKGSMGTLTVIGGCARFRGAPALAAMGALRAGAGLVRVASTERVCAAVAASAPCATLVQLPEDEQGGIGSIAPLDMSQDSAVLAGCGMGGTASTLEIVTRLLHGARRPLVLDADALNVLAADRGPAVLKNAKTPVIITPHIGEMSRLRGLPAPEIAERQADTAREFALEYNCVVALKSHVTVVAAPDGGLFINDRAGNPGLARGGSGDVLAGIIASLAAQGMEPGKAAACGVWLHAAAADLAVRDLGQNGMLPSDLPLYLGKLWAKYSEG